MYRKYRSKKLSEVIGQDHITQTLQKALDKKSISHAYLLTGPRGVGKTSVARILAHLVNDLPYDDDSTHLDIIEIDAASNRRIDEIRELNERVHIAPTSAHYKVYIIDEVHMLTKEAFNALLKTLEEPPDHVIFILATTEAHKLPETIISRTQRFGFRPVEHKEVVKHLKTIAKSESISVDDEALDLIAQHGQGSFRDSISLLDQVSHMADKITFAHVQSALGLAQEATIDAILNAVQAGDKTGLGEELHRTHVSGVQSSQLAKQLSAKVRADLIAQSPQFPETVALKLLHSLSRISAAPDADIALELALYEVLFDAPTSTKQPVPLPTPLDVPDKPEPKVEKAEVKPSKPKTETAMDLDEWQAVLEATKTKHNTLHSIIRMADAKLGKDNLILSFNFPFHQKRLSEEKNKQLISDIINQVTGRKVKITSVLVKTDANPQPESRDDSELQNISNIFGSAEVLE